MRFGRILVGFARSEDGATTVDWVVLTAGVVGLTIAVLTALGGATHDYWEVVGETMDDRGVPTY